MATSVKTNKAIKSFHCVVKVHYKKQNCRIDQVIHVLLKISCDKVFERLQKTQKGKLSKLSHCISEINKWHRTADKIVSITGATWRIKPGEVDSQQTYTVEKLDDPCTCKICCSSCDVCVHSYSCMCKDNLIHGTICKHIHLVKKSSTQPMSKTEHCAENDYVTTSTCAEDTCHLLSAPALYDVSNDAGSVCVSDNTGDESTTSTNTCDHLPNIAKTPMETPDVSSLRYLSHQISNQENLHDISTMQETAISTCQQMELALRDCMNIEAIKAERKHLNTTLTIVTSLECKHIMNFPVKKRPAPNAHSEIYLQFHSTMKKHKVKTQLGKHNQQEMAKYIEDFEEIDIELCGICFNKYDPQFGCDIDWMQCQLH